MGIPSHPQDVQEFERVTLAHSVEAEIHTNVRDVYSNAVFGRSAESRIGEATLAGTCKPIAHARTEFASEEKCRMRAHRSPRKHPFRS